eukprot:2312948-Pyramimonas_sp.AAC.1
MPDVSQPSRIAEDPSRTAETSRYENPSEERQSTAFGASSLPGHPSKLSTTNNSRPKERVLQYNTPTGGLHMRAKRPRTGTMLKHLRTSYHIGLTLLSKYTLYS